MDYQVTEYATAKQRALLKSKGVSDEKLVSLTKKEASNLIDELLEQQEGNGQNYGTERISRLLEVADELMEHVQTARVYQKLNDEQKV